MVDHPNSLHTLGITLDGPYLQAAQISFSKNKIILERIFEFELAVPEADENTNPLLTTQEGQNLLRNAKSHLVATSLKSDEVMVRPLEVKLKKEKDIDAVLSFQAEPLIPYQIDEALLDRIKLSQTADSTQLTLLAARKEGVKKHIELWESFTIEPEVVSCSPIALALFSKGFCSSQNPLFILHLGNLETVFVLALQGKLLAAQSIPVGISALQNAINEDQQGTPLTDIDFSTIDPEKYPHLKSALDNWRMDVTRVLYALAKQFKSLTANEVLLTGEGASLLNLGSFLCLTLNKILLAPEPTATFDLPIVKLQRLAIPIGAAISGFPEEQQVNFRQKELAYPRPWSRLKKPLMTYYALCCALALAIYFFGQSYLAYQEDELRQEYIQLLSVMNKQYSIFEKEYEKKHPSGRISNDEILSPKMLTAEGIGQRIYLLQKELNDTPDMFPLLPNTPRVSDLLAWLSTHPVIATKNEDPDRLSSLQIDSLSYSMVKRPEIKKKQEKYQVKVEIEFTTTTPKLAREFHDALISPNDFIDPKGEVKWSSNRGKYNAVFYLKDRTVYPAIGEG